MDLIALYNHLTSDGSDDEGEGSSTIELNVMGYPPSDQQGSLFDDEHDYHPHPVYRNPGACRDGPPSNLRNHELPFYPNQPVLRNGDRINVSTHNPYGCEPGYQKLGYVYPSNGGTIYPLMGRPKYRGSSRYEYFIIDDSRNSNRIDLDNSTFSNNQNELFNGDTVTVPEFGGVVLTVKLYDYQQQKYIPAI